MQKKTLILGGSSFVGRHLINSIDQQNLIYTFNDTPIKNGIYFNLLKSELSSLIKHSCEIAVAVILLGDTEPDSCFRNPALSHRINVEQTIHLIDYLIGKKTHIIFTSSEYVFDGIKGEYDETNSPNPILLYGQQKLEVEKYLVDNTKNYTILRLAKIYSLDKSEKTLFTNWIQQIFSDQLIRCAIDQKFSPVYVGNVAEVIKSIITSKQRGLFHVGGPKGMFRIDLLNILIEEMKKEFEIMPKIALCRMQDFDLLESRPLDVSLNIQKTVNTTGISPLHPIDACKSICQSYNNNYKQTIK